MFADFYQHIFPFPSKLVSLSHKNKSFWLHLSSSTLFSLCFIFSLTHFNHFRNSHYLKTVLTFQQHNTEEFGKKKKVDFAECSKNCPHLLPPSNVQLSYYRIRISGVGRDSLESFSPTPDFTQDYPKKTFVWEHCPNLSQNSEGLVLWPRPCRAYSSVCPPSRWRTFS